jgi:hypothetical protein
VRQVPNADEAVEALESLDRQARLELAFEGPGLDLRAATWAANQLYRTCQLLVFRDGEPGAIRQALSAAGPEPVTPEVVYSVDLTFRYLPDLMTLARAAASEGDPLVDTLLGLARAWPLSSVGMRDVGEVNVDAFRGHPALRQLYIDRIIARRDLSRLADPRVREAVREAIGLYPQLAPELAGAIHTPEVKR